MEVGFRLVDAFTETPFKGNRLCVVPEIPEGLSDDQMRMLALETNFSAPADPTTRCLEGWIMGLDAASLRSPRLA